MLTKVVPPLLQPLLLVDLAEHQADVGRIHRPPRTAKTDRAARHPLLLGEFPVRIAPARRVAIVAGGCRMVAAFDPAVVLIIHHVAVGARSRMRKVDQDRALAALGLRAGAKQGLVRALPGRSPSTAGDLVRPSCVSAPEREGVEEVLARIRTSELGEQQVSVVLALDAEGDLIGTVSLAQLARAAAGQRLGDLARASTPTVFAEADLPDVALLMTDYNLIAMPVLDHREQILGVITVDDAMEVLLPERWLKRLPQVFS